MQPSYGGNVADRYLVQKINGATPEQLAILLLEGAQRFLTQAIDALQKRDIPLKARMVNRVSAIIEELTVRLNHEAGGELVANLASLYEWWLNEIFEGSQKNKADRLELVLKQMGEIRGTWQELEQRQVQPPPAQQGMGAEGMVG